MRTVLLLLSTLIFMVGCGGSEPVQPIKIGDQAPLFNGLDLDGNTFNLGDFAGEPVLIRFWESNCKFCKADTPVFNELQQKYKDRGLHIAYINTLSNLEEVTRFVADLKVNFPVLMDEGGIIAKQYHVRIVPQTIVINRQHKIIGAISGGVSEPVLLDLLKSELR